MSVHRSKLDLAQLTARLLASRARPKRQYLIEQIGRIWSLTLRHSCIRTEHRHHHPPTDESINAVVSFVADHSPCVRMAIAAALGANPDATRHAIPSLIQLLADSVPAVRITAANTIFRTGIGPQIDPHQLQPFLQDDIWSVRWAIAGTLFGTSLHNNAWRALADSIPRSMRFLDCWADYAERFADDLCRDDSTRDLLHKKMAQTSGERCFGDVKRLLARCEEKQNEA